KEPGRKVGLVAEGAQVLVESQEDLPGDVFGIFGMATKRISELIDLFLIATDQRIPRGGMTGETALDQNRLEVRILRWMLAGGDRRLTVSTHGLYLFFPA